ncbi:MAG TPA: bacteriohopanetetrol glucosamine biosynthesis glycosyltransferase HpnI [Candidatus Sulfotelmatobacter sp.]|nr:bacteriohopanetetrol glucosamine biosynthesis glycosyltransferase HpnI [Candidatus Sulfotelmatobacter sp.]
MSHSILRIIEIIAVLGATSSAAYYVLCLLAAATFLRERRTAAERENSAFQPPISILKPIKGLDPEMYSSLRSHCLQDYPEFEIIFGVSDAGDPSVSIVQQLQREFPDRVIHLVICPKILGSNVKVSNLAQMAAQAKYEYLIVNDGDIRVERDYLRRVIRPLAEEKVGLVTCLYRGVAAPTLGSKLEALGIGTDFCPGVLAAWKLERGINFALGSTQAFRRADLEKIGGFETIVEYLADDYELGNRIHRLGKTVHLSDVVVETHLPPYDLRGYFAHQLRWARGVRDSRPGGYFGLIVTFGLLWSLLVVLASGGAAWSWIILAATILLRAAVASMVGKSILGDPQLDSVSWLLPLRDLLAFAIWIASFAGHTVTWRGDRFRLEKGKLIRI